MSGRFHVVIAFSYATASSHERANFHVVGVYADVNEAEAAARDERERLGGKYYMEITSVSALRLKA